MRRASGKGWLTPCFEQKSPRRNVAFGRRVGRKEISRSFWSPFAYGPATLRLTTEVNMATELDQLENLSRDDEQGSSEDLAVIREQTSETLQILRNLLSLMMPKEDDGGPKLVDLIAALVAQQRDILVGIRRLPSDVNALFNRTDGKVGVESQRESAG